MIWKSPALLSPYEKPLRFNLNLEKSYRIWLSGLYLLSLAVLFWMTALPSATKIILSVLVTAVVLWRWRRLKHLPVVLLRKDAGEWLLKLRSGEEVTASLSDKSFSAGWFVILYFTLSGEKSVSIVMLPYMLEPDGFRQLSAYLRMVNLSAVTDE